LPVSVDTVVADAGPLYYLSASVISDARRQAGEAL